MNPPKVCGCFQCAERDAKARATPPAPLRPPMRKVPSARDRIHAEALAFVKALRPREFTVLTQVNRGREFPWSVVLCRPCHAECSHPPQVIGGGHGVTAATALSLFRGWFAVEEPRLPRLPLP